MPYDVFGGSGLMSKKGTIQIPMLYTVLVGGAVGGKKHVALVDAGFGNQEWMSRSQFFAWEDPPTVLRKVRLKPEDVDAILVTHLTRLQLPPHHSSLFILCHAQDFSHGRRAFLHLPPPVLSQRAHALLRHRIVFDEVS